MPPAAGFVMEMINNGRAVIFGGRDESQKFSDTVYIVDVINENCTLVSHFIIMHLTLFVNQALADCF